MLKNLLFLNPFDKDYQADLRFIKNYYRFIPALMLIISLLMFLVHIYRQEFAFLAGWIVIFTIIISVIGSNDWRLNISFIASLLLISTYFTNIPDGLELGDVIAISILSIGYHYFSRFVFVLSVMLVNKLNTLIKRFTHG